jgi:Flp pilus assembly protein TadD
MLIARSIPEQLVLSFTALLLGGCAALGLDRGGESRYDSQAVRSHYRSMLASQTRRAVAPELSGSKLLEGDRHLERGDLSRAVLAYFEAARLAPDDPTAHHRLAWLELDVEPARAERSFGKLIEAEPERASLWLGLGLARLARSDLDRAVVALQRSLDLAPDSVGVFIALGAANDRLGRHKEAQDYFRRGLEIEPEHPQLLSNLAVSYLLDDQPKQAEIVLRRAAAVDPSNPIVLNNLGLAVGLQSRYEEALTLFRRSGDEQSAQNNLGYVYYLMRRLPDALRCYEQALLLRGDHTQNVLRNLETAQSTLEREESFQ